MTAADEPRPASSGHRFVLAGDCCSGIPGGPHEATFAAISARIAALEPAPDFLCFLGDHIDGLTDDEADLRAQWRHWRDVEFGWARTRDFPVYHLTSNHNTYDAMSERVFRETFPELPQNGPAEARGLSYFARHDDLLLVVTHQASARLGPGRLETGWLAEVLAAHREVPHKLVLGHYPVLPVNGYRQAPRWRLAPADGEALWRLLVAHGVTAYLCSHVIAYDLRVRQGVAQICTAGAGTRYGPTGDFMRGDDQFFHFLDCRLDDRGLSWTAVDETGRERRRARWPMAALDPCPAVPVGPDLALAATPARIRFDLETAGPAGGGARETLLCGYDLDEGPATLWVGREGARLVVEIVPRPGGPVGRWTLDDVPQTGRLALEIVPNLGPGGVLASLDGGPWSSLATSVAEGLERVRWPQHWCLGHGPSGSGDQPFRGTITATGRIAGQ